VSATLELLGKGITAPDETIFSARGNGRRLAAALASAAPEDPAKLVWFGDSVTEGFGGVPVYRLREMIACFNGNRVSPGWVSACPDSAAVTGGVLTILPYKFGLTTGTLNSPTGHNQPLEQGLSLYAFKLAANSELTLKDVDNVNVSVEFSTAEIHYTAHGTAADAGDLQVIIDGTLEETIPTYDASLGAGNSESGRVHTWTGARGPHTLVIKAVTNEAVFEGVYLGWYDEKFWIYAAGNAGEKYDDFLTIPSGFAMAPTLQAAKGLDADGIFIAYGINDYADGAAALQTDVASSLTALKGLMSDQPTLGVIVPHPTGSRADWDKFLGAARIAAIKEDVPVCDLSKMFAVNPTTADPFGLVVDGTHPSEAGGRYWAAHVARFIGFTGINWADQIEYMRRRLIRGEDQGTFTGEGFAAGLTVTKLDTGKAYLLLQDDKASEAATTGLFGEISANGRGATTLLGSSGINGLAGFRFRAASTWTDTSAPTDIEVFNCAASSVTVAVRATFLAGGGLKFPEMTPPAGVANNVILCGRDDGELVMVRPDSSIEPIASRAPRVVSLTSSGTPTPNADITDLYLVTALAATAAWGAPTGTIAQGQKLMLRIKDNGTARTMSWDGIYRAIGVTLPLTTVISKTLYIGMVYNFTDTKWDVLAVGQQA